MPISVLLEYCTDDDDGLPSIAIIVLVLQPADALALMTALIRKLRRRSPWQLALSTLIMTQTQQKKEDGCNAVSKATRNSAT